MSRDPLISGCLARDTLLPICGIKRKNFWELKICIIFGGFFLLADTLFQGSSVKRFTFQFGSFICSVKFDGSICVGPSIRLSLLRSHRSVRPFVLLSLLPQSLLPPLRPSFCPLSRPSLYLSILHFVHYERQSSSFYPPIGLSITPSVLHRCSDTVRPSIFPRSSLRPSIRRYVRA